MNILKINKNNITSFEFDESTKDYVETDIQDLKFPFTRYFSQVVEIAEDVTIEDFMCHLKEHHKIIDLCFYGYINGESIVQYCDLALEEPSEKYFVDTVELFWATELVEDEYCLFGTFHGTITKEENYNYIEANRINSFPLDLVTINNWKHCKISINEVIKASSIDEDYQSSVLQLRNRWTLFELIQFFLYELMCYGSTSDQKEEMEIFAANQIKYGGFRVDPDFAETLDKEELMEFVAELENQIFLTKETLIMAVNEEDFEEAKELRDEEEELKAELKKMKDKLKKL